MGSLGHIPTEYFDDHQAELLGLGEAHAEFIRNATPGNERQGFAEAVFTAQGESWFPLQIANS